VVNPLGTGLYFFFRVSLLTLGVLGMLNQPAPASQTGTLASFTVDPATSRERNEETSRVEATVTLTTPSPAFFVCEIRSEDSRKVTFENIIFKKGDLKGKGEGVVHWKTVLKDSRVRVSAFNTDAPDQQISFTVILKPASPDPETDPAAP
jgi:hypothetical protein